MSTIKEILEDEETNTGLIRLYREGLFYKAYERSTYLWTQAVCRYEVKVRHVSSYRLRRRMFGGNPRLSRLGRFDAAMLRFTACK